MEALTVTIPYLPAKEAYQRQIDGIWERNWLTNHGPLVEQLEARLRDDCEISRSLYCVANGGLGLQLLLRSMGIGGRILTTPFTYIATTSCSLWEGHQLDFADIEASSLNLDPASVEASITPQTEAILATHVFGNPCDQEALAAIASKHGVALIYDAAHAFGVREEGQSVIAYGDASVVSTHATKVFHTIEGGFVVAKEAAVMERIEWMRRYAHKGFEDYHGIGINAKMSEAHAAMGLCMLEEMDTVFRLRRLMVEAYDHSLENLGSLRFAFERRSEVEWNYAYYPVLFENEETLLRAKSALEAQQVFPRRYFYPLASVLAPSSELPVAEDLSRRTLCLPLYAGPVEAVLDRVLPCLESVL